MAASQLDKFVALGSVCYCSAHGYYLLRSSAFLVIADVAHKPSNQTMKPKAPWPRKDHRGVDLISDTLAFGRLCYGEPNTISNAVNYAKHRSRSQCAAIRVYDEAGTVIETHEQAGDFKEW